jgi:NAD(P)H-dependent FMN reductase
MSQPITILAISGSLRVRSSNTAMLRALAALAPAGVSVEIYAGLAELPPFNPDLDPEGDSSALPAPVRELRALVGRAAGLVIASPEYAHGIAGALKNALDWLVGSQEFPGKPLALLNAAPRASHAYAALAEVLTTMNARLVAPACLAVPLSSNRLDTAAMLADPAVADALSRAIAALAEDAGSPQRREGPL